MSKNTIAAIIIVAVFGTTQFVLFHGMKFNNNSIARLMKSAEFQREKLDILMQESKSGGVDAAEGLKILEAKVADLEVRHAEVRDLSRQMFLQMNKPRYEEVPDEEVEGGIQGK
jgi:hypothetical protein